MDHSLANEQTLRQLDSVKAKLSLLLESLSQILELHPATPWQPVLEQLNNIIARFESTLREIETPEMSQALLHPHMLIPQNPDFIPQILLRTKLIPEIDDSDKAVNKIAHHNEIVGAALDLFNDVRSELESALKIKSRSAAAMAAPAATAATNHRASIEHTLAWMSSGHV
eukprot:jgi/Hompol1/6703/HPOL_000305-RA